jgi:hypothetical protein
MGSFFTKLKRTCIERLQSMLLVALCILGLSGRSLAQTIDDLQWYSLYPRVVSPNQVEPITFTAKVLGSPESLRIALKTGDSLELESIGNDLYEATLTADQLLFEYQIGDAHNHIGSFELPGPCNPFGQGCLNLFVNVRTDDMPDITTKSFAPDVIAGAHIVNIRHDDLLIGSHANGEILHRFYEFFADEFDFIATVKQVRSVNNRSYFQLRNNTLGTGRPIFDFASSRGSPHRLLGTINYPIDSFFDLAEQSSIHEIGHHWINHLNHPLLSPGIPHWPISDLAYGIMGLSIGGTGGQGGNFPYELVELPNGDVQMVRLDNQAPEYNDLELYLMGLISPDDVGEHIVLSGVQQGSDGQIIPSSSVERITIDDIITEDGPRVPAVGDAQTNFRIATIILSNDRLLTNDEIAFFDHMAARGESIRELPFTAGFSSGITKPFFLATGGRATLSTIILDADGDGVPDGEDAFPLNANESVDTDSDGMGDNFENAYGLDPEDASDASLDKDSDGSSNLEEFLVGRNPTVNEAVIIQIINSAEE